VNVVGLFTCRNQLVEKEYFNAEIKHKLYCLLYYMLTCRDFFITMETVSDFNIFIASFFENPYITHTLFHGLQSLLGGKNYA